MQPTNPRLSSSLQGCGLLLCGRRGRSLRRISRRRKRRVGQVVVEGVEVDHGDLCRVNSGRSVSCLHHGYGIFCRSRCQCPCEHLLDLCWRCFHRDLLCSLLARRRRTCGTLLCDHSRGCRTRRCRRPEKRCACAAWAASCSTNWRSNWFSSSRRGSRSANSAFTTVWRLAHKSGVELSPPHEPAMASSFRRNEVRTWLLGPSLRTSECSSVLPSKLTVLATHACHYEHMCSALHFTAEKSEEVCSSRALPLSRPPSCSADSAF